MKKVIYPRYSISQDLRCKFSLEDRKQMILLRKEGLSYQKIADYFGGHPQSIWQIITKVLEPEKYRQRMKKTILLNCNRQVNREAIKRFYTKKRKLMLKEMKRYTYFLNHNH